jgi:hypothetical protein
VFVKNVESGEVFVVKGVNKQIVEIVRTDNAYFEKAILFVNPEKLTVDQKELQEQANYFVDTYIRQDKGVKMAGRPFWRILLQVGCGALGGALLSMLLFLR